MLDPSCKALERKEFKKMALLIIIVIVVLFVLLFGYFKLHGKNEKIKNETVIAYIGGLGSGKTLNGANRAIKLYKKNLKSWKQDKDGSPAPILVSNIPLQFKFKGKKYNSINLNSDILTLKQRLPLGSITFIDEIGTIASQFDWNKKDVKNELTEFVRLYRQYTKGGYLVITEQTLDSIVKPLRDRINAIVYCLKTNTFSKLASTQFCVLRYTQQIDSYTADSLDNLRQRNLFILKKHYDTFAYSTRYVEITKDKPVNQVQQDSLKVVDIVELK